MTSSPAPGAAPAVPPVREARKLFVFDCYDTLVVERDPGREPDLAGLFAEHLDVSVPLAKRILYPVLAGAFRPYAVQEETGAVLARGLARYRPDRSLRQAEEALWHAVGNADGRYRAAARSVELLRRIRAAGHEVRLLSNCVLGESGMHRLLDTTGLSGHLDRCHFSSEGRGKKPDPTFLRRAADGRWSTIVMVGDSPTLDIEPARALGWETVQIRPERPCWERVAEYV
ncbi:HAD family hydrolase [Streptomyces sp. URMC 123]|uniref:HAD family hydrolase n=1 Tax=Streptomyces sp. URMC 123 TaxID=3423403 RepID=UPI003F1B40B3